MFSSIRVKLEDHLQLQYNDIDKSLNFCTPTTFDNPLQACLSNKKYLITIQTRSTQIVKSYFLLKTRFFNGLQQNQLPITVCSDIVCNKT